MKHAFFKFIPAIFALSLIGCGSDSGSSASEESSSSESSSSVSSSSYSNRLDVLYADTLTADTLRITPRDSLFSSYCSYPLERGAGYAYFFNVEH